MELEFSENEESTPSGVSNFEFFIRKKISQTVSEVAKYSTQLGMRKKVPQGAGEIITLKMVAKCLKDEEKAKQTKLLKKSKVFRKETGTNIRTKSSNDTKLGLALKQVPDTQKKKTYDETAH